MTRYLFEFLCVCALGVMPMVGCSETGGDGGSGGTGGTGASAGTGGTGGMAECQGPEDCDDGSDCTENACADGMCEYTPVANGMACDESNECTVGTCAEGTCDATPLVDGSPCGEDAGTCQQGSCQVACTEQGLRDAIAVGGGPYTFSCDGPQTVVTEAEIVIDNDVILDGEGELTVDGNLDHRVLAVAWGEATVELRGFTVTRGVVTEDEGCCAGGLENGGTLTLTNCTVSGNSGAGIRNGATMTLMDSTVSDNSGSGIEGSGASNTTLVDSIVSGNSSLNGGGIMVCPPMAFACGSLTLVNSTVSGNTASSGGGGIYGGEPLTLTNSTVSGNSADHGGGIIFGVDTTLINSTVSGNTAATDGGGILVTDDATLINSTVSGNSASNPRGDGIWQTEGILRILNTTVSGNVHVADRLEHLEIGGSVVAGECTADGPPGPGASSSGYNIESPGDTCGFDQAGDQSGVSADDLKLGPLQDNGGDTMTHALGVNSVAIDRIPALDCEADEDQRGVMRPQGDACDVGAFELEVGAHDSQLVRTPMCLRARGDALGWMQ